MTVAPVTLALLLAGAPAEFQAVSSDVTQPTAITSVVQLEQTPAISTEAKPAPTSEVSKLDTPVNPIPDLPKSNAPTNRTDDKEIVVTARTGPTAGDPLETVNAVSFQAVQTVDKAIIGPVARGYKRTLPKPVRNGVRHFINNLNEPIVFVNFLLQLKPGRAATTAVRFVVNSTIGVAGLMDVASKKPLNLRRRSNGLADTLGYYNVKPGPYLFLPLIGSTTIRDMIGRSIDLLLLPSTIGAPFNQPTYHLVYGSVSALDERSELDDELRKIQESDNPYAAMREYYLKRREAEINELRDKDPAIPNTK